MVDEKNITSDKSEQENEQSVKYYYYTARILVKDNYATNITYESGAISTYLDDFPIRGTLKTIAERNKTSTHNVMITYFKQITESNFKAYNDEQD